MPAMPPPSDKSHIGRARGAVPASTPATPSLPPEVRAPKRSRPVIPGTHKPIGHLARAAGGKSRHMALS